MYDKYIYKYKSLGSTKLAGYRYTYDNNNNVTAITYDATGKSNYESLASYIYDSSDRMIKETREDFINERYI